LFTNVVSCFYLFTLILPVCPDQKNRGKCQTASQNFHRKKSLKKKSLSQGCCCGTLLICLSDAGDCHHWTWTPMTQKVGLTSDTLMLDHYAFTDTDRALCAIGLVSCIFIFSQSFPPLRSSTRTVSGRPAAGSHSLKHQGTAWWIKLVSWAVLTTLNSPPHADVHHGISADGGDLNTTYWYTLSRLPRRAGQMPARWPVADTC